MNSDQKTTRGLGIAFLLQGITSLVSGAALSGSLIVDGDIVATMTRIANQPALMRTNILLDVITAMGIVFLGVMLFLTLRKHGETMALVAMGLYILEAALLAVSRMGSIALLHISQESVTAGHPAHLQMLAKLALESAHFVGSTLHMLVFCVGAILFYILLTKSTVIPRAMSLWGLVTVFPMLVGTLLLMFGAEAPIFLYVAYVPFEFVVGVWILIKGVNQKDYESIEK